MNNIKKYNEQRLGWDILASSSTTGISTTNPKLLNEGETIISVDTAMERLRDDLSLAQGNISWLALHSVKGLELTRLLLGLLAGDYFYREGQETIATIVVEVVRGDTTLTVHPSQIVWSRESTATGTEDADWAARHPNIDNTLTVTEADMVGDSTTFVCTLYDENGNVTASKAITF